MTDQKTTPETEMDENRLIAERRSKLERLREQGRLTPTISGKTPPAASYTHDTMIATRKNWPRSKSSFRWQAA